MRVQSGPPLVTYPPLTPPMPPQVLTWYDDDDNGTPYGKGSDLWSLGVLLYVILSGCSPFSADEEELLLKQARPATLGAGGCSTRCWRLQHQVLEAATPSQPSGTLEDPSPVYPPPRWRRLSTTSLRMSGRISPTMPRISSAG